MTKSAILALLTDRVLAYRPIFSRLRNDKKRLGTVASIFLSQLFYWQGKEANSSGWIYKTQKEWENETGLSRDEQQTARRRLCKAGILTEKLAGNPARLWYKLEFEAFFSMLEAHILECGNPTNKNVGTLQARKRGSRKLSLPFTTQPKTHPITHEDPSDPNHPHWAKYRRKGKKIVY